MSGSSVSSSPHDTTCRRCKGTGRIGVVGFEDRKPRGTATCMSCIGYGSIEKLRDALLGARKDAA
jgi:DnaJ-class molecular chaperone